MINKQNLWFLTLFSLILVLSVYYITMPSELLISSKKNSDEVSTKGNESTNTVNVEESDLLVAMRVSLDEERKTLEETLQETLTSAEASTEDKNSAYEQIRCLNTVKGKEDELEAKIKKNFKVDNFIKIDQNQVKVVIVAKEHNNQQANNIMRSIQESFKEHVYVTVKFEK
ncbi:MAG: SpoIIIAH-like family protein [Bacilli bacterium]